MAKLLTDTDLVRLLREKFAGANGAQRLAQELVALLGADYPENPTIDGPINVRQPAADIPAINITPFPGATAPPISTGGGGGGGGGGTVPSNDQFPSPPATGSLAPLYPTELFGIVQSGTGNVYTVRLWITNPSTGAPLGDYPCYQGQIDPAETIQPGTECRVWCAFTAARKLVGFRMNVPLFQPAP